MSPRYEVPEYLAIPLGRSRVLAMLLSFMHVGAVVVLVLIPAGILMRAAALVLICVSLLSNLGTHAFRTRPQAIKRIEIRNEGWTLISNAGQFECCRVIAQFVHAWFVVLRLKPEGGRELSLVIARDALAAESFRALRARLNLVTPHAA